mmetsp:Transcript_6661/g.25099  ORF Transcript_6661/g.25099 Transcript_6661/m.25099 type:complete len:218 (-) Transcript_6661:659-1312(-)
MSFAFKPIRDDLSSPSFALSRSTPAIACCVSLALRCASRSVSINTTFTDRSFLFSSLESFTISAPAVFCSFAAAATSVSVAFNDAASSAPSSSFSLLSCACSALASARNSCAPFCSNSNAVFCARLADFASDPTFLDSRSELMNFWFRSRRRAFCAFAASSWSLISPAFALAAVTAAVACFVAVRESLNSRMNNPFNSLSFKDSSFFRARSASAASF